MAKVMISLPDTLLERIDAHASAIGETRSGFLRQAAEGAIAGGGADRRRELEALLGPAVPMGGDAVGLIRADRESR